MSPLLSRLSIAATALLWSTGGAAIKSSSLGAPAIAGGRAFFAAIALLLHDKSARQKPHRQVFLTALAYAATCILFVFANRLTTAATAIFIQNTAPVWVLLLSARVLGERATRAELYSVPISLAGCVLFFVDDLEGGHLAGNLCALAASLTYALLIVRYRQASRADGLSATVWGNLIIVVSMVPLAVIAGTWPSTRDLLGIAYLGLIQQALAATLFVRGIAGVSAVEGALLTLLEPMMAPIWAYLWIGERPGALSWVGAALILGATVGRTIASTRQTAKTEAQTDGSF
ncbi:MAG: EamA family transporter [Myxococcota bacterium]